MKKVMLCGRPAGCCPSIKEDTINKIMHIVGDDGQDIPFTEDEVQNLRNYLNKRG